LPSVIDAASRRLVLVSGPPGAGKTTIAGPLAAELGFALLAKDQIKESLADSLGDVPDVAPDARLAWSRRLGAAAMDLLWTLAQTAPAVVLEANFWPDDPRHRNRIAALAGQPVEVFCYCPVEVATARYAQRSAMRHLVHHDSVRGLEIEVFTRSDHPIGVGEVITVDTTAAVDIAALADVVRTRLPQLPQVTAQVPAISTQVGVSSV
jgi:predicted kinase